MTYLSAKTFSIPLPELADYFVSFHIYFTHTKKSYLHEIHIHIHTYPGLFQPLVRTSTKVFTNLVFYPYQFFKKQNNFSLKGFYDINSSEKEVQTKISRASPYNLP